MNSGWDEASEPVEPLPVLGGRWGAGLIEQDWPISSSLAGGSWAGPFPSVPQCLKENHLRHLPAPKLQASVGAGVTSTQTLVCWGRYSEDTLEHTTRLVQGSLRPGVVLLVEVTVQGRTPGQLSPATLVATGTTG